MSKDELVDRVSQHVNARLDAYRSRRGHDFTLVSLSPVPAAQRGKFFFSPAEIPALAELFRARYPSIGANLVVGAEKILHHRFDLLGYENLDYGTEIDWHFDLIHGKRGPNKPAFKVKYLDFAEVGDSKITWELNRHQHLVTLAKAFCLTGDARFAREIFSQWNSWRTANPYPNGMNWASSLEVALRSLSWIWVYFLMQGSAEMTEEVRLDWIKALALSGRHIETYLSTYFSPNTHLLGEGVALFFLGTLFPELPKARRWKQRGWAIVLQAAKKQVRSDGFYFEQSTYYHVYALDFFLHARVLAARNDLPIPAEFDSTIIQMLDALCLLGRAGMVPTLGDDDGGRVFDARRNRAEHLLDPLSTGAVLYQRGDFKFIAGSPREETLWLLGSSAISRFEELRSHEPSGASSALTDSGLYLMADSETGQQLLIDAGPHGPGTAGHGHADALSVHLVGGGETLLMDPGTLEYVGETFNDRNFFRGTAAHNTLRVDERDQADGSAPFAWRNLPTVQAERWVAGQGFNLFAGTHDGYQRLPLPVSHRRWVFHRKSDFWLVRDVATGPGTHQLELSWHLGPSLSPTSAKDYLFGSGGESLGLLTVEGHGWSQSAQRGIWSPVYGRQERTTVVTFGKAVELPAEFVTLLLSSASAGVGRLERIAGGASVRGYRYTRDGQEHYFFFSEQTGSWTAGEWGSDAYFLCWSYNRHREQRSLILCGGTHADVTGRRVVTCDAPLDFIEVTEEAGKIELFSSDPRQVHLTAGLGPVEAKLAEDDPRRIGV
jgi:Heparinase II/III-like protein/Heparinase II/III N-terminus